MMTNDEYHAANGVSKSMLDKVNISPLAYWDTYINPDRTSREETHPLLIGGATHSLVLEPDTFMGKYAIGFDKTLYPDALDTIADLKDHLKQYKLPLSGTKSELVDRIISHDPSLEDQILYCLEKKYNAAIGDKTTIPAKDYHDMLGMLNAISGHHSAGKLLCGASVEQSFFVEDEFGLVRKCRPDAITKNGRVICDLKTTIDVGANSFSISCYKYRYHVQAAWYLDTMKLLMGDDSPDTFCLIPVQKSRPYDVAVYVVPEELIQIGRMEYQKDYALLRSCLESNTWPGSDGGNLQQLFLPKWAMQSIIE